MLLKRLDALPENSMCLLLMLIIALTLHLIDLIDEHILRTKSGLTTLTQAWLSLSISLGLLVTIMVLGWTFNLDHNKKLSLL